MNKYNATDFRYAGHRYRSKLEAKVAETLDNMGLIMQWEYEYTTIELDGQRGGRYRYKPDFWIKGENQFLTALTEGLEQPDLLSFPYIQCIIEVKGFLTQEAKMKLQAYEYRRLEDGLPPLILATSPDFTTWELAGDYLKRIKR